MTIDHRRPFVAYLLCAAVCGFVIVASLRGTAPVVPPLGASFAGILKQVATPREWFSGLVPATTIDEAPAVSADALVPNIAIIQQAAEAAPGGTVTAAAGTQVVPAVATDTGSAAPAGGDAAPSTHHAAGQGGQQPGPGTADPGAGDPGVAPAAPGAEDTSPGNGRGHAYGHRHAQSAAPATTSRDTTGYTSLAVAGADPRARPGNGHGTATGHGKADGKSGAHGGKARTHGASGKTPGKATGHGKAKAHRKAGKSQGRAKGHRK